jgi:hypothetical protein
VKLKQQITSAVAVLLVILFSLAWFAVKPEPMQDGKPLSYWLSWLTITDDTGNGYARRQPEAPSPNDLLAQKLQLMQPGGISPFAESEVVAIGTDGIPTLLRHLSKGSSGLIRFGSNLSKILPGSARGDIESDRWQAVTAVMTLHKRRVHIDQIVSELRRLRASDDAEVSHAAKFLLTWLNQ